MTTERRAIIKCPHCNHAITIRDVTEDTLEAFDEAFGEINRAYERLHGATAKFWRKADKAFRQVFDRFDD